MKKYLWMSSAAVVVGALRVNKANDAVNNRAQIFDSFEAFFNMLMSSFPNV